MKAESEDVINEPSASYEGKYSYADYLTWQLDEMVEIIKGKLFKMTAAPNRLQSLLNHIVALFSMGLMRFKTSCTMK